MARDGLISIPAHDWEALGGSDAAERAFLSKKLHELKVGHVLPVLPEAEAPPAPETLEERKERLLSSMGI